MYLLHVRMSATELAAIRATLVVGSASLAALAQRAAHAGQTIIRNPNGLIWRPGTDARKPPSVGSDRTARSSGANPWGGRVEHQMAGRLDAEDVVTIRESLASGSAFPDDLARQYRVSPRTIKQIATHSTWKHVSGPKLGPTWGPRTNTGYWGVTANGAGNRFTVSLYHDGRKYAFGWFKDVVEAARAYDAKAREVGLPSEKLNFRDED